MGAARPGALADYLVRKGHVVEVITTAGPGLDNNGSSATVERTPWVRLPSFRRVDEGAPGNVGAVSESAPSTRAPHGRFRAALSAIAHDLISVPDPKGGWIPYALAAARRRLAEQRADVIVASGPTFAAHIVASIVSRQSGVPWVADYRDLWSDSTYYPYSRLRKAVDRLIERWTLESASSVTAVSQTMVEDLMRDFSVAAMLVRNGYDLTDYPALSAREPLGEARVNLLYVGNNFYHGRRTPQALFRAARDLNLGREDLQFHFLGSDPNIVMPLAAQEGVAKLVTLHGRVSMIESRTIQANADALMLLTWNHPGERGILTGKLFEYAGSRRPIVLTGYPDGEAAEIVRGQKLGWVVADADQARSVLQQLLASKASSELLPDLPESRRHGLSREAQFEAFEGLLSELVGRGRGAQPPPAL